jgi:hypothetical protein
MNILIVESENDQYFIQALVNLLNNTDTTVCCIDDFKHSNVDEAGKQLKIQIGSALTQNGVSKIGVMLDMDEKALGDRINLVNKALDAALKENFETDVKISRPLERTNEFIDIYKDELITVKFACYFTNIDGQGELETLLKEIKTQDSVFADCLLEGWQACLKEKGKKIVDRGEPGDITHKEILKLWVDFYKRFDTLKKGNRNKDTTDWKNIWLGTVNEKGKIIPPTGKDIFKLDHEKLNELTAFLKLFH